MRGLRTALILVLVAVAILPASAGADARRRPPPRLRHATIVTLDHVTVGPSGSFSGRIDSDRHCLGARRVDLATSPGRVVLKRTTTDPSGAFNGLASLSNGNYVAIARGEVRRSHVCLAARSDPTDLVTLDITIDGTGTGTVTFDPPDVTCAASCSESYERGTSVTLTANPGANSTFYGWRDVLGCGIAPSCTVPMDSDQSGTATFTAVPF
jgi:hypothetical protein